MANPNPTPDEVLEVVFESINTGIRNNATNIAFQQVRTAPERLVVHLSAFELYQQLEERWAGQFRVLLERKRRHDLLVRPINEAEPPFVFEFKVPWSRNLIVGPIVKDFEKVLKDTHTHGYVVTVFLKLLETPDWALQRGGGYGVEQLVEQLETAVRGHRVVRSAEVIKKGSPIQINSAETRIECTVLVWKPIATGEVSAA